MWRIVIIALIVVLVLVVLLRRRGASGPSDDALRDSGLTPESSRIRPDNHGAGEM
jgi:hypothetical protein